MNGRIKIGIALVALSAMFAVCVVACSKRITGDRVMMEGVARSSELVRVLNRLRAGDTNRALEALEFMLDHEIAILGDKAQEMPEALSGYGRKTIESIVQYRTLHPRTGASPELALSLSNNLALLQVTLSNTTALGAK